MQCSKKIPDELTRDDHRRGVALISKLYASHGITSVCEADTSPDGLQAYQDARDAGELLYRAYCHMNVSYLHCYIAAGLHTGFGDSMVRIGGIKQYADGSISERTAWLAEPYIGIPNYTGVELGTRESSAPSIGARPGRQASNSQHTPMANARSIVCLACTSNCSASRRDAIRDSGSSTAPW